MLDSEGCTGGVSEKENVVTEGNGAQKSFVFTASADGRTDGISKRSPLQDIGNLVEISRTSIDRRESRSPVQKRGRPMTSDLNLLAEQIARNSEEHQRLQRLWQEKQVATQILKPATVVNGLMETIARGGDKGTSLFQPPKPPEIGSSSQAKNNNSVQASKITTGTKKTSERHSASSEGEEGACLDECQ
ncbi:hypothetical protein R1sor_021690 [Riccia sorocarpa]|uniref:Uncharacterized protein n=1 Tax=Riccia sorocarpa TaxID=122646 RepID=A0ABD3GJX8_9MARC